MQPTAHPAASPFRRLFRIRATAWAALVCLFSAHIAYGATIIGNLPQSNDVNSQSIANGTPTTIQAALVFTTGSSECSVSDVVLRLGEYNTTATSTVARVAFFLDNGSGTNTGAQVGSNLISPASSSNAIANFTFLPSGSLSLAANTKYWMVVSETDPNGAFAWWGSNPITAPTGAGANFNSTVFSNNGGALWGTPVPGALACESNGTVPEPTTLGLLALGSMALLRRRKLA